MVNSVRSKQVSNFLGLIFLVLLVSPCALAADEFKPYLHKPSVGSAPKLDTFGEYRTEIYLGAGIYTYDIKVPPGAAGLQPKISLVYNSQSATQRPGTLGAGWYLAQDYVLRDVNHTLDFTRDDYYILALNNNRYKFSFNGTYFKTETNPREFRIQNLSHNGQQYFVVSTKDGMEYRFGYNNNSFLQSNTGRNYGIRWNLDRVRDVHNNALFYSYRKDPYSEDKGTMFLTNITCNDTLKAISFQYEAQPRPDLRLVYEQGNVLQESRRLTQIKILFNNGLVRGYKLGYQTLNDRRSLSSLANITRVWGDNVSVVHTIRFQYYNPVQGFDNTTGKWIVPGEFAFSSKSAPGQDFGVRLLDVNNDGFPDLIKAKSGSPHSTYINNKIGGWANSSALVVPPTIDIVDSNGLDNGVRFEDVNSDGLVDILVSKNGTGKRVFLNNGTAWVNSTLVWHIPEFFVDSAGKDLGAQLVDVNGDGRMDIVVGRSPDVKRAYLNNGPGWKNVSEWILPDFFVTNDSKDNGLRFLDLNNDALPDLLKGGMPGGAWLNNGSGWMNNTGFRPNLDFTDHAGGRPDLGVRFMDINGDGLVDMLQNFFGNVTNLIINQTCMTIKNNTQNCTTTYYNVTNSTNTKLNNGTGWVPDPAWICPVQFTSAGYNIGRRIADVNGDGYGDIVVAYQGSPYENITFIKKSSTAFLLKQITNAYGGKTNIAYAPSTLADNGRNLGFNVWTVGNMTLNNSLSPPFSAIAKTSYYYSQGKYDYANLEFRGFGSVNESLPDNSLKSHFFYQDNILKGREYKTVVYDASHKRLRQDSSVFDYSPDNMVFLRRTSSSVYDGNSVPLTVNTSYDYDYYGNPVRVNSFGNTQLSGDERFEGYSYVYNLTSFVVNKQSNYTLLGADNQSIVKQAFYFYDNKTSGISKGDLTKVRNYNNAGQSPETKYSYDTFGNVISRTDALGHSTFYQYDDTGTLNTGVTDALGHYILYNYYDDVELLMEEVRDGNVHLFDYDIGDRLEREALPLDDMFLSPSRNYTYIFDGAAPEVVRVRTKNNATSYSEDYFVYDGFGNLVQKRATYSTTSQIVKNYFYDSKFRINAEQNPYFDSYSAGLSSPLAGPEVLYAYDSLDRTVNITKQDSSSILVVFNRTLVTQFDENKNRIDYLLDVYGRIVRVREYNVNYTGSKEVYNTTYKYRADDLLVNITDSKGDLFLFNYDSLGRKTSFKDPNMARWRYVYDLNGNLVNQTDGRNKTISLVYDSLNRVIKKYWKNESVKFLYDVQYNGTLSNVTLNTTQSAPIYLKYYYDARLRVVREGVFVPITDTLRRWVNFSVDYDSSDRVLKMYLPQANLSYGYNLLGKLARVQGFLDSVNYNAFGSQLNKSFANGVLTKLSFDSLGRVSGLRSAVQALNYSYDRVGNILQINDSKNSKLYSMNYDNLSRLTKTKISDFKSMEHERLIYQYDRIGNVLRTVSDRYNTTFSYGALPHTPAVVTKVSRPEPSIQLTLLSPNQSTSVNQYQFFNFTAKACCRQNDCWGVNLTLDPFEEGFTSDSETHCANGSCNLVIYSGTRFVFEDGSWKRIESARSLKDVLNFSIEEDQDFPAEVVDFNFTSITLDLGISSNWNLLRGIPLRVYDKFNSSALPRDAAGNVKSKDRGFSFFSKGDRKRVVVDLSDTSETVLTQAFRWGDHSTLITVQDFSSKDLADTYVRNQGSYNKSNFGTETKFMVRNTSTSLMYALIKFNLSQIPREAIVDNARLYLNIYSNHLPSGTSSNISVYRIFQSYNWTETGVTWNNRPSVTQYNRTRADMINIPQTTSGKYVSWNVTSIVKPKRMNESFYLYANNQVPGTSGDVGFYAKEGAVGKKPYLNITYTLKGKVSMTKGETPFYTVTSNPYLVDLEQDQCKNVTWLVNATGAKRDYLFFVNATKVSNGSVKSKSSIITINII